MKRENLESKELGLIIASRNFPFYAAPEADAVMDELEERIKELESENEKLKKESVWLRSDRATAWNMNEKSCEEACKLRKENAKLKCLALHAMGEYFNAMYEVDAWDDRLRDYGYKYKKAYRKAKKELKEGK